MNNQQMLIGGAAVAGLAVLILLRHTMNQTQETPRYEAKAMMDFPVWHPGDTCGGVQDNMTHPWRVPVSERTGNVVTRHRYPSGVATNVTAVMHHGFDALKRPAPQDDDWVKAPPSDVMW